MDSQTTKHTHEPNFGRRVQGCPRCDELANGAKPRKGWGAIKRENEARFLRDLREHDYKARGCGPVCTFGDW